MRIINIDAEQDIAMRCLTFEPFILQVVRHLDVQLLDPKAMVKHEDTKVDVMNWPIRFFETPRYENVATLLRTIPIYLRGKKDENGNPACIDKYGAYFYDVDKYSLLKSPYIEIYPKTIEDDVKDKADCYNGDTFMWLFTKVLLHELAHAAMDIHNCAKYYNVEDKLLGDKEYRKLREESMANAIALRIIKNFAGEEEKGFYEFCKNICLEQGTEYAVGAALDDFIPKDFSDYIDAKVNGIVDRNSWLTHAREKIKSGDNDKYSYTTLQNRFNDLCKMNAWLK